jgi:hypothetical protein
MKNILLQYQGGGFDGCYWQWNYCYWDKDGKWQNIYSTGRNGVKTEQEAQDIVTEIQDTKCYIYDLDNEKAVAEFVEESQVDSVKMVAKFLYLTYHIILTAECDVCGCDTDIMALIPVGDESYGGLARGHTDLVCANCYCEHICGRCGEFYMNIDNFKEVGGIDMCEFCQEEIEKRGGIDVNNTRI